MRVLMSLGHKKSNIITGNAFCDEHEKMPEWGIFNASVFLNEHGHTHFLFQN